ncbi:MAG: hypothetical protein EBT63_04220 [Proteobacteria bacterium]|jgi:hypothetical protein|nr:hypothetical protein [Pseudomonadota bacterium]NCA28751.1 hypothetical protein [Pseudomonadota bacterium]
MKFLIYRQTKSAMQSGKLNTKKWILEPIESQNSRSNNNIMHWVSTDNTKNQLRFEFATKQDAIDFASKKKFDFNIIEPQEPKIKPKSYAENFTN